MKTFFSRFWRRLKSTRKYSGVKFVSSLSDVPGNTADYIYIVGTLAKAKWVVFDCPCSQGHRLTVNLMKSVRPRWNLKMSKDRISLSPSIIVTDHPCRSHFWLESNRIYPAFVDFEY
jgi:hypothetical protein